jgi:hypothetical protein
MATLVKAGKPAAWLGDAAADAERQLSAAQTENNETLGSSDEGLDRSPGDDQA